MALISMQEVSLGFGGPLLLDGVNLQIERGEWVGLLGRQRYGQIYIDEIGKRRFIPGQRKYRPPAEFAYSLYASGSSPWG